MNQCSYFQAEQRVRFSYPTDLTFQADFCLPEDTYSLWVFSSDLQAEILKLLMETRTSLAKFWFHLTQ